MNKKIFYILGLVTICLLGIFLFKDKEDSLTVAPVDTENAYTLQEVASHNSEASCWTVIGNVVYDVTTWISQHPGGKEAILSLCGKDGTEAFHTKHANDTRPGEAILNFRIGTLK